MERQIQYKTASRNSNSPPPVSVVVRRTATIDEAEKNRARQLHKNISMLFLFPVKDGKLSTGVNATFDASCYG